MIRYEWKKLFQKKQLFIFAVILLLANMVTIYVMQKNTAEYHYIYEKKEVYQRFLQGDTAADVDGFYQQEQKKQKAYQKNYAVFLSEMERRAENMSAVSIFSGKDSFSYRNIKKTCEDFKGLQGIMIQKDNCYGIQALASYDTGIIFFLIFLFLLAWYVFFQERNKGILLLLKGTQKGHMPLALGKLGVMAEASFFYILLQESMTILFFGYLYGYGNLKRSLQSVPQFRNCPYRLSVGETLVAWMLLHLVLALVLTAITYLCSACIRSELTVCALLVGFSAVEFAGSRFFSIVGPMNGVKTINAFFCWNLESAFGMYQNLNLFHYAIGKDTAACVTGAFMGILCCVGGVWGFHRMYQIHTAGRLERLQLWLRKRLSVFGKRESVFYYEWMKVWRQQKKGWIVLTLTVWSAVEISSVFAPQYYAQPETAMYHGYLKQLVGPVTEESISYVEGLQEEVRTLQEKSETLDEKKDEYALAQIQCKLGMMRGAVEQVTMQLERLKEKDGLLSDKYWVDEVAYQEIWFDVRQELQVFFIVIMGITLWASGIVPMDEKKGLIPLLSSTRNGRHCMMQKKKLCVTVGVIIMFLQGEIPVLLRYWQIDHFETTAQKLSDFTMIQSTSTMSLGIFLLLLFLIKAVVFALFAAGIFLLSRWTKNEMVTNLIGIGLTVLIVILCYYFDWDVSKQFLYSLM